MFEEAYAQKSPEFSLLLSAYFRKKKDAALRNLVADLYRKARGLAGYRQIFAGMGASDDFDAVCDYLAADLRARADMVARGLEERGHVYAALGEKFVALADMVRSVCTRIAAQDDLLCMQTMSGEADMARMPVKRNASAEERAAIEFLSGAKKETSGMLEELASCADRETEHARYLQANALAHALGQLALAYDDAYSREKGEAGVLDYNDLEQIALQLLDNESVRSDLAERYRAVFVDEYQDVNPVQEAILSRLGGGEVFLVGDAKQAIYGFRGSRSEFFEEKEKLLPCSLRLSANFRSAPAVLEATNEVFSAIAEGYVPMRGGERYGAHSGEVAFHLLPKRRAEESGARGVYSVLEHAGAEKADALADKVAQLVEEELGSDWFDADAQTVRKVGFGDIAVLTRRREGEAAHIARALLARGIPVTTAAEVNVCDFFEARLLIDWLSYLDNAEQDIPYCTALLSAAGGLTERELAAVRLYFQKNAGGRRDGRTFRAACAAFIKAQPEHPVSQKLAAFDALSARLRARAQLCTAAEIMNELLALGLEAQIAAKEGGRSRLARVRRLIAEGENVDVNAFLARLRACNYQIGYAESGGEDSVRIVTMHSSKGLEYPVVILIGAGKSLKKSSSSPIAMDENLGIAVRRYVDGVEEKTVKLLAIKYISQKKQFEEEMFIFYVALTRAKNRLYIIGEYKNPYSINFDTYFDYIFATLSKEEIDKFLSEEHLEKGAVSFNLVTGVDDFTIKKEGEPFGYADEKVEEKLREYLNFSYRFKNEENIAYKNSVTSLTKKYEENEVFLPSNIMPISLDAVEVGNAYHLALKCIDFNEINCEGDLEKYFNLSLKEVENKIDQNLLFKNIQILKPFTKCGDVFKEQEFVMKDTLKNLIKKSVVNDEILVQGVVDLFVINGEKAVLIDYKYSSSNKFNLINRYKTQLILYKNAIEKGLNKKIEKMFLLNLKTTELIEINGD